MVLFFRVYRSSTLKYSKIRIPGLFLTMHLIFLLAEKYFEPSWKSGLAKTRPAGPFPLPLHVVHNTPFSTS